MGWWLEAHMLCCYELHRVPIEFLCWSPNARAPQSVISFGSRVLVVVISADEVTRMGVNPV